VSHQLVEDPAAPAEKRRGHGGLVRARPADQFVAVLMARVAVPAMTVPGGGVRAAEKPLSDSHVSPSSHQRPGRVVQARRPRGSSGWLPPFAIVR